MPDIKQPTAKAIVSNATRSPKTTIAGIFAAITLAMPEIGDLLYTLGLIADVAAGGNGVVDWNVIVAAVMAAIGFSQARDGDKSSQAHRARTEW